MAQESPDLRRIRPPTSFLGESTNLRVVRLRLFLGARHDVRHPDRHRGPVIYGLAWGFGTSLVVPTLGLGRPRRGPRHADRLAGAAGARAGRAPRGGARGSSRTPTTARGPRPCATRSPGSATTARSRKRWSASGHGDPARPAAGAGHRRPRRLQADQRLARARGRAIGCSARRRRRSPRTCAALTARSASAATSSRSSCPAPTPRARTLAIRRLLAGCLDGDGRHAPGPRPVSFSAGISAVPGPGPRPRLAVQPGRRGAVLEQAPRADLRDDLRPRASRGPA